MAAERKPAVANDIGRKNGGESSFHSLAGHCLPLHHETPPMPCDAMARMPLYAVYLGDRGDDRDYPAQQPIRACERKLRVRFGRYSSVTARSGREQLQYPRIRLLEFGVGLWRPPGVSQPPTLDKSDRRHDLNDVFLVTRRLWSVLEMRTMPTLFTALRARHVRRVPRSVVRARAPITVRPEMAPMDLLSGCGASAAALAHAARSG